MMPEPVHQHQGPPPHHMPMGQFPPHGQPPHGPGQWAGGMQPFNVAPPPPPPPMGVRMPSHMGSMAPPPPPVRPFSIPLHLQPELRIFEMNKRLAFRAEQDYNEIPWWEGFSNEFFDDNARLTIRNVQDESGYLRTYSIGRTLIPRFFRSFGEGGATDLSFNVSRCSNMSKPEHLVFESDLCTIITKHGRPMFATVFTEGQLVLEFNVAHEFRISHWVFTIRRHQELIPRSAIAIQQDAGIIDQLSKNITRTGLPQSTINYLKLCSVLEPMQEIMAKSQQTGASARESLRLVNMQRSGRGMPANFYPPGPPQQPMPLPTHMQGNPPMQPHRPMMEHTSPISNDKMNRSPTPSQASTPSKRRKRKNSGETKSKDSKSSKKNNAMNNLPPSMPPGVMPPSGMQPPPGMMMAPTGGVGGAGGDVMVVGEPSLMGGDFGEEDERLITRLENNQLDFGTQPKQTIPQPPRTQTPSQMPQPSQQQQQQIVQSLQPMQQGSIQSISQPNSVPSHMGGHHHDPMLNQRSNSFQALSEESSAVSPNTQELLLNENPTNEIQSGNTPPSRNQSPVLNGNENGPGQPSTGTSAIASSSAPGASPSFDGTLNLNERVIEHANGSDQSNNTASNSPPLTAKSEPQTANNPGSLFTPNY